MFDDLSQVKRRYEELAYRMTTPEAMNDPAAYAAMMREYKELTPLVEAYRSYTALQKEVDEEKALLDAPTEDAAFNDMVQQELRENWQKLEDLEQKIRLLLLPKDANDEKSIIMEIRAGAGGEEAALFAHTTNLGDYLSNAVLETETFCVRQAAAGQLSPVMEAALNSELSFLQKLCGLKKPPVFTPIVDDYYKGMAATVPLHRSQLTGEATLHQVWQALADRGYPQSLLEDLFWNNLRRLI